MSDVSKDVAAVHAAVDASLSAVEVAPTPPPVSGLLAALPGFDPHVAKAALGDAGILLREFALRCEPRHPDLPGLAGGYLSSGEFEKLGRELLATAKYATEQGCTEVVKTLSSLFTDRDLYGFVAILASDLANNVVRMIKDPATRHEMRSRRDVLSINLVATGKYKSESWEGISPSFGHFVRGVDRNAETIANLRRRASAALSMGLTMQYDHMLERVSAMDKDCQDRRYDFNRCPLHIAAAVAAKQNGFIPHPKDRLIPSKPLISRLQQTGVVGYLTYYQPRLYPLPKVRVIPDRMGALIDSLDSFPGAAGMPIFDHFSVLIPSLSVSDQLDTEENVAQRTQTNDNLLIASKIVVPILLGECAGKHYFIDYFSE